MGIINPTICNAVKVRSGIFCVSAYQRLIDWHIINKYHKTKKWSKDLRIETLKEIPFSVFETDTNTYKITYHITSKNAPNGTYSLFYTVVKENGEFLFSGMLFQ